MLLAWPLSPYSWNLLLVKQSNTFSFSICFKILTTGIPNPFITCILHFNIHPYNFTHKPSNSINSSSSNSIIHLHLTLLIPLYAQFITTIHIHPILQFTYTQICNSYTPKLAIHIHPNLQFIYTQICNSYTPKFAIKKGLEGTLSEIVWKERVVKKGTNSAQPKTGHGWRLARRRAVVWRRPAVGHAESPVRVVGGWRSHRGALFLFFFLCFAWLYCFLLLSFFFSWLLRALSLSFSHDAQPTY